MSHKYTAEQRLSWLHHPASNNVDGYEWGIYRVKYENGQMVESWQTLGDFSDLDAAMAASAADLEAQYKSWEQVSAGAADSHTAEVACSACEVGLTGTGPDTQQVCPQCDGAGCAAGAADERGELVPLTDVEVISLLDSNGIQCDPGTAFAIVEIVERAHGIDLYAEPTKP